MEWTKNRPSEEGYYYDRNAGGWELVEVARCEPGDEYSCPFFVRFFVGDQTVPLADSMFDGHEWLGPIEPPPSLAGL